MNEEGRNKEDRNNKNHQRDGSDRTIQPEQDQEVDTARFLDEPESRMSRASWGNSASEYGFTDIKQFPEDPNSYRASKQEQVQLNMGTFQHEVTDFVLPGRDGFDLKITRRYDSGEANTTDMKPHMFMNYVLTGTRENNHNTRLYGLGYGWSFVLPSIEAVPYMYWESGDQHSHTDFQFVLHLEDGRNLKIGEYFNMFRGYQFSDVTIGQVPAVWIAHPYQGDTWISYNTIVSYQDGRKDYFQRTGEEKGDDYTQAKPIYRLVAREDRFGNQIFFQWKDYGQVTIIDTWGRSIKLEPLKETNEAGKEADIGLVWSLPDGGGGSKHRIEYHIKRVWSSSEKCYTPVQLDAVVDLAGRKTTYLYHDRTRWIASMQYVSKDVTGTANDPKDRPYVLLNKICHPSGAETHYTYGYAPTFFSKRGGMPIIFSAGGVIRHFPLISRKEVASKEEGEPECYQEEYFYQLHRDGRYIQRAQIKRRKELLETFQFDAKGLLKEQELFAGMTQIQGQALWVGTTRLSYHTYTYGAREGVNKGKITIAKKQTYSRTEPNRFVTQDTAWTYDSQGSGRVVKLEETYPDDSSANQITETTYGSYGLVTEIKKQKAGDDTTVIREAYELDASKGSRVVRCHRIYQNQELQAKTVYEYSDGNNPYCVTKERRYIQAGKGPLGEASPFVETSYSYNSSQYTHAPVKKTQTGLTDADGQRADDMEESYVYDAWGRLLTQTDPRGGKTYISYDPLGRITQKTLPQVGSQTRIEKTQYLDAQNRIRNTDVNGFVSLTAYTPFGQVKETALARPDGTVETVLQRFSYSSDGDLLEVLTYDGSGRVKKTEQFSYDSLGRCTSRKIPEVGYEEQNTYEEVYLDPKDHKKYLREQTTIKGDQNAPDQVMVRCLDQKGQLRRSYLADKLVAVEDYDWMGNRISSQDALGRKTTWTYDYAGRELSYTRQLDGRNLTVKNWYDAMGNLRFQTDEAGQELEYRYDQAGRCIQTIAPLDTRRQITHHYYDASGNLIKERKASEGGWLEVRHRYDAANRVTETDQYHSQTQWIRTRHRYDAKGQLLEVCTGETPEGPGYGVTRYRYNRLGNILSKTDALGYQETYQYDPVGRLLSSIDRNGAKTEYQYDALDRLVKEKVQSETVDGPVGSEQTYAYSRSGQRIREVSRQSENGAAPVVLESRFAYDNRGQLTHQVDPGGIEKRYTYDLVGNRSSMQLMKNGQNQPELHLFYHYDALNRLSEVRSGRADGPVLAEYTYDVRGNRIGLREPQAGLETTYQYNQANQVIRLENRQHKTVISAWTYQYNQDGTLRSKTDQKGITITYRYDRMGRLIEEDDPGWKRSWYAYDANSNRIRMQEEDRQAGTFAVTTYQYDRNNRLEQEVRKQGTTTETYQYRYDRQGNETFRIWEKRSTRMKDPGEVILSGGRRQKTPTVYEWRQYNGFGQLIRIYQDDGEVTYQYRSDGLRHSRIVKRLCETQSKETRYAWDGTNLVLEQESDGTVNTYQRGLHLIARQRKGVIYYYVFDAHGDVVQVRKPGGGKVSSYTYDAFGHEKDLWEEDENPFRYCGEYFDGETKTLYLRNRDYRPGTGRFTQEDAYWHPGNQITGDQQEAGLTMYHGRPDVTAMMQGGNRYAYGLNNPVRYRDPSGNVVMVAAAAVPVYYVVVMIGTAACTAIVTNYWYHRNSDKIVEVLAEGVVTIGEGAVAIGEGAQDLANLLHDGITAKREITSGYAVANASNATRISASEKAEGNSETGKDAEAKKKDPTWAPDPDKSVEKQLQGQGQLKDLRNSPNTQEGVDMNDLLKKTPRELEEMKRNGEITKKTLTQIKKAFQGRDLGGRGKNK